MQHVVILDDEDYRQDFFKESLSGVLGIEIHQYLEPKAFMRDIEAKKFPDIALLFLDNMFLDENDEPLAIDGTYVAEWLFYRNKDIHIQQVFITTRDDDASQAIYEMLKRNPNIDDAIKAPYGSSIWSR